MKLAWVIAAGVWPTARRFPCIPGVLKHYRA